MTTWWSIIILILLVFTEILSLVFNMIQYYNNKENKEQLDLTNNSLKLWLDSEVEKKRNFSKLSEAVISDRDEYRKKYLSLYKKYNRLNKYVKSFIKWRIDINILISKIK